MRFERKSILDYRSIDILQHVPYIQSGGGIMNKEAFGQFIADARRKKGITQQSLADQLHVTNSAVSKWERGLCYPDVTLLEDLACALGITLTQLIACDNASESTNMESNMASLLDITNESNRRKSIRVLRNTLISALSVILMICTVYFLVTFLRTNTGSVVYIGSQTQNGENYIYMDKNGDLLRLHCEDQQMFDAIVSGFREERYTVQYRWNIISKEGELLDCHVDDQILGTPMDEAGSIVEIESLFGIRAVQQEITNIYPDPNHSSYYRYSLRFYYPGGGAPNHFFTVKACLGHAYYDYDSDGVIELFIYTIYDNAPYMLYDIKDGVITSCFVDDVPKAVLESLTGY